MHIKEQISANEFAERVWQELRAKGFIIKPSGKGFEVSRDEQEGAVDPCPRRDHNADASTDGGGTGGAGTTNGGAGGAVVDEAKVEAEMRAGIKKVSANERYALLSKMKTIEVGISRRAQDMKLTFRIID